MCRGLYDRTLEYGMEGWTMVLAFFELVLPERNLAGYFWLIVEGAKLCLQQYYAIHVLVDLPALRMFA